MRSQWSDFQGFMASSWLENRAISSKSIYTAGEFVLQRFITDLNPKEVNHLGEAIASPNGEIQYLKTYRLSAAQTRRDRLPANFPTRSRAQLATSLMHGIALRARAMEPKSSLLAFATDASELVLKT